MPVNSIVVAACLEWMQRHTPTAEQPRVEVDLPPGIRMTTPPRWATIRRAVEQAVWRPQPAGMYPFDRFSDKAKELLMAAQREANEAGFNYIGTEHLLLGAFGEDFQSGRILSVLLIDQSVVREAIKNAIGKRSFKPKQRIIPTSRVKRVIEIAFNLCETMGDARVGTKHVLLALATEGEGIAAHVLKDLGATRQKIESEAAKITEPES